MHKLTGLVLTVSLVGVLASPVAAARSESNAGAPPTDPVPTPTTTEAPPTVPEVPPIPPETSSTTPTTPPTAPTTPQPDPTIPTTSTTGPTAPPSTSEAPTTVPEVPPADAEAPPSDQNVAVEWSVYDDTVPAVVGDDPSIERSISQDFPGPVLMTGLSWASGDPHAIWLQQEFDGVWGEWELLSVSHAHGEDTSDEPLAELDDESATEGDRPGTDAILLIEPDAFRFLVEGSVDDALAFIFTDQQPQTASTVRPQGFARSSALALPALPVSGFRPLWAGPSFVQDRASWDTTNCRVPGAEFEYSSSKAVIVHHAAGSNNYTAAQVPAVLRGLCAFSTGSRGFDGVGYNFVVDKFGTVWEGRTGSKTSSITGAHARAFNSSSQGVVLLGDFSSVSPSVAQVGGLRSILNWLTGWYGINPSSLVTLTAVSDGSGFVAGDTRTIRGVAGHREVGQTSCPGDRFFPSLSGIATTTQPTNFGSTPTPGNGGISLVPTISAGQFSNDANNDGNADVIALRSSNQTVYSYFGNGSGGFGQVVQALNPGAAITESLAASDWTGDGRLDVITRRTNGNLFLSAGVGDGTFSAPAQIGSGWQDMTAIFSSGDWDGDNKVDLIARASNGTLLLYSGNGSGGWLTGSGQQIGSGWQNFNQLFSPGDFTGDGHPDVIGRDSAGVLVLYSGNGSGGWLTGRGQQIGTGWQPFVEIESSGDFDGDARTDILAYQTNGILCLYSGNGAGGWRSGSCQQIGTGWQAMTELL